MVRKIYLAASLAWMLFIPREGFSADITVFDQFSDAFGAGLFQGIQVGGIVQLESYSDSNSTQAVNVISYSGYSGSAVQIALSDYDVTLTMGDGDNNVQAVNAYKGSADFIKQIAVINGAVTMISRSNVGSIQGINVICDSCK
ncbi:hypothetical protein VU07_01015 [Desulfobulbus sp. F4]|nr:hypothetical protein [Desulfobulbus sp. F3]MCW5200387.1 hypothetical protein [Desulfobulbus sp. F4]